MSPHLHDPTARRALWTGAATAGAILLATPLVDPPLLAATTFCGLWTALQMRRRCTPACIRGRA